MPCPRALFGPPAARLTTLAALGSLALTLSGCKPDPAPPAASTAPLDEQLMRAALPGWGPTGTETQVHLKTNEQGGDTVVEASAAAVIRDGEDKAVLIVAGQPLDAGHVSQGVLSAYWLERKQGRWVRVAAQEPVDELGASGLVGTVKALDLGAGLQGFSAEWGSCWQGYCMNWLHLYVPQGQRFVLAHADLASEDTSGAHPACEEALKAQPGSTLTLPPEHGDMGDNCLRIDSQWRILTRPATAANAQPQPGELELRYTGLQVTLTPPPTPTPTSVASAASVAAAEPPASGGSAAAAGSTAPHEDDDNAPVNYRVQHQAIRETQVLRFEGGKYKAVSGKNPNRGF